MCINFHQTANDKICPRWQDEKEIEKIKTERNVSYMEAKKFQKIFSSGRLATYVQVSAVKKAECKSVEVQTLMTWPCNSDKPKLIDNPTKSNAAAVISGSQTAAYVTNCPTTKDGQKTKQNAGGSDPKGQLKLRKAKIK